MTKKAKIALVSSFGTLAVSAIVIGSVVPTVLNKKNTTNVSSNKNIDNPTTPDSISNSNSPGIFTKKITNKNTSLEVQLHSTLDTIYSNANNLDEISAVIDSTSSVTLTTALASDANNLAIENISYQWYYTTTKPTGNVTLSDASSAAKIETDGTSASYDVTNSLFTTIFNNTSKTGVIYLFAVISFSSNGYSQQVPSGLYVISNNGITFSQTINGETNTPTTLLNSETAELGLTITNNTTTNKNTPYSNITYAFTSSTNDEIPANVSWTKSDSSTYSVSGISGLNFYFANITYDYEGTTFATTTAAYVLSGLDANIVIESGNTTSSNDSWDLANGDATLSLNTTTSGITSSVAWYDTSTKYSTTPALKELTNLNSSDNTLSVTSKTLTSGQDAFYYAYLTYSYTSNSAYNFSVLIGPVYILNDGAASPQATNNQPSSNQNNKSKIIDPTVSLSQSIKNNSSANGLSVDLTPNQSGLSSAYTYATLTSSLKSNEIISSITYQWYSNTSDSTTGASAISNETSSTYTLDATNNNDVMYYFLKVTYKFDNETFTKWSDAYSVANIMFNISIKEGNIDFFHIHLHLPTNRYYTISFTPSSLPQGVTDYGIYYEIIRGDNGNVVIQTTKNSTDIPNPYTASYKMGRTYNVYFTPTFNLNGNTISLSFQEPFKA